MSRGLFLLFICLLWTSICCSQKLAGEAFPGDSTYRRVIRSGRDSLDCYLAYPSGGFRVQSEYAANHVELAKLDAFMHRAFGDTMIYVRTVRLTGYSSIDGTYAVNMEIARNRALGMKQYLDYRYGLSARCFVSMDYVGEDWVTLRRFIAKSWYPWREEALAIIDGMGVFEGREALLMKLDRGTPYRTMKEFLFPQLRRVEVKVEYDLKRIIEQRYQRKMSEEEFRQVLERERRRADSIPAQGNQERVTANESSLAKKKSVDNPVLESTKTKPLFYPLLGLKTNLLAWAGITPEWERTTFMPNLSAEVFFAQRWSVEASAMYADFGFGKGEHWSVTGYGVEPRLWLKAGKRYRGFYFGVFGQAGDFNVQRTTGNYTGTYVQSGVCVGYYVMLTRGLGMELGLRGGYQKADATPYEMENGYYYRTESPVDDKRLGVMGVKVSLNYRFGR